MYYLFMSLFVDDFNLKLNQIMLILHHRLGGNIMQIKEQNFDLITKAFIHELRNPLALLKGTIQYIESSEPDIKGHKYWNQLEGLIEDMEDIIQDFYALNSNSEIAIYETDLFSLITDVTQNFMPLTIKNHINLSLNIEKGSIKYLQSYQCNSTCIKQAINNLLKNAFEAVDKNGHIVLHVDVEDTNHIEDKFIVISISNTGETIDKDILNSIFTPFVTYKSGGNGIGLCVVEKVIHMHNGSIKVDSNNDLTTFTIELPIETIG